MLIKDGGKTVEMGKEDVEKPLHLIVNIPKAGEEGIRWQVRKASSPTRERGREGERFRF